jgi:hypothetical protein
MADILEVRLRYEPDYVSNEEAQSTDKIPGVGIGGDYPLSAVMVSE